jgi:Uma2 family endonuclease
MDRIDWSHDFQRKRTRAAEMSHPDKLQVPEGIVPGEPTWGVVQLYPAQGAWSELDYLALDTNHLVEFGRGVVEFLPMPTMVHQVIVYLLHHLLMAFVTSNELGSVLGAPFKVKLWEEKFREPDVLFMKKEHATRMGNQYWEGADLVMEVVSDGDADRRRDLEIKREEYAQARIAEYWIVDPKLGQITVLTLDGSTYAIHGEFSTGQQATSKLLPGFAVDVTSALSGKW